MLWFMCAACGGMCYMCRGEVLMKDLYLCRWWRLYGVDTDMPGDRHGHKRAQLLMNTHAHRKYPSPRIDEYAEDATCINRKAQNQSCHPQQHPLSSIYDIPSSAFLLPSTEFIFCFARRIFVLLACRSIVSVRKEQTRAKQRGVCILEAALWLCIEDI